MVGEPSVVFFDGVCALCDRSVKFLSSIDKRRALSFAPLQGETAERLFEDMGRIEPRLAALVYARRLGGPSQQILTASTGLFAALADIGGLWVVVSWLRWIPRPIRDAVYFWVVRNRYRWFGRYDSCVIPRPEDRERFLP
jgi:predicted DCC family thiol-disulfide oxidoreductase YuxK